MSSYKSKITEIQELIAIQKFPIECFYPCSITSANKRDKVVQELQDLYKSVSSGLESQNQINESNIIMEMQIHTHNHEYMEIIHKELLSNRLIMRLHFSFWYHSTQPLDFQTEYERAYQRIHRLNSSKKDNKISLIQSSIIYGKNKHKNPFLISYEGHKRVPMLGVTHAVAVRQSRG